DPAGLVIDMARCLKPGGLLLLGTPRWPSVLTIIPNFVLNAPPHHLTWWTEPALHTLAGRAGMIVERVDHLPPAAAHSLLYWMARAAPKITGKRYFRSSWWWAAALAWSWVAGVVCDRLFSMPPHPEPDHLLLVAHKPAVPAAAQ